MFVLAILLFMMVIVGMAVDYMRHENARADLQNALDRGILAATNIKLDISTDEEAQLVIAEYMNSRSTRGIPYTLNITDSSYVNGRALTATAQLQMPTIFLKIFGITEMAVPARSVAIQGVTKTEIALVVDISGSMTKDSTVTASDVSDADGERDPESIYANVDFSESRTKLDDLKLAATWFVDQILTDESRNRTLISVVPYSSQVNIPDSMAAFYNIENNAADFVADGDGGLAPATYHNCIAYDGLDFSTAKMDRSATYERDHHFVEKWNSGNPTYGCPKTSNAIFPYSNNNKDLKDFINALEGERWTASYMGVKWGAALLHPDSSVIVDDRITDGLSSDFDEYPLPWDDADAQKVLILMSDGRNTKHNRIKESTYAAKGGAEFFKTREAEDDEIDSVIDNKDDTKTQLNGEEYGPGDEVMQQICTAFDDNPNTVVYTIGFELSSDDIAVQELRKCATKESMAYAVEGEDLVEAFDSIAASIKTLRLSN